MQREAAVACSACCRSSWRTRRGRAHIEPHTNQSSSACPSPSAASAPDAAGVILTPLVRKFMPWLEELRSQLRVVTVDVVRVTRHFDIDAESAGDTDDDDEAVGDERSPSETFAESQRLGARLGSLVTLLHEQLLPRLPHDPEALFLVAAADFARQDIEGALRHMQRSLLPEQRATRAELSRRHYFVAVLCIRLLDPRATDTRVQASRDAPKIAREIGSSRVYASNVSCRACAGGCARTHRGGERRAPRDAARSDGTLAPRVDTPRRVRQCLPATRHATARVAMF